MGLCESRNRGSLRREKDPMIFLQKLKLLQKEIRVVLKQREEEREAYEREMMMFAFKEADWRKEKKQLRDEVRRLRRKLEEREERMGEIMEDEAVGKPAEGKREKFEGMSSVESGSVASSVLLVEQMREERARRDEAVEKWKMLYLAIKHELDDLIQRTHCQGTLYWRDEEDMREKLQRELKAKDETIQVLKAQIASMEEEDLKKKREVDILKQSLRILCSKKGTTNTPTSVVKKPSRRPSWYLTWGNINFAFVN